MGACLGRTKSTILYMILSPLLSGMGLVLSESAIPSGQRIDLLMRQLMHLYAAVSAFVDKLDLLLPLSPDFLARLR